MNDNGQKLIGVQELAELLSLPPASVRRYARCGKLPFFKVGRLLRFDVDEVKAAIKEGDGYAISTATSRR